MTTRPRPSRRRAGTPRPGLLAGLAVCVALLPALAACSGSEGSDEGGAAAPASSAPTSGEASGASASAASLTVPDGVELTEEGSRLDLGDHAVVAYEPRQDQVGVLDIRVDSAQRTTFKQSFSGWRLDGRTKKATPYFVHARVKNIGDTDLGGRTVPLYVVDDRDTLVEPSTFASRYAPCPSTPFPKKFRHGDRTDVCLVYFAPDHGELTAVSFRPSQEVDAITWTGEVTRVGGKQRGRG